MKATFEDKRLVGFLIAEGATRGKDTKKSTVRKWTHSTGQPFFSCPMPNNQNCWVLGFYIVTDYWKAITEDGEVTMARLERWNIEENAWFASQDPSHNPPPLSERDFDTKAPDETCQTCQQTSPRMFEEHFLCRHKACPDHWKYNGETVTTALTYTKAYLQQREPRSDSGFKPYGGYRGKNEFPEIAPNALEWWEKNYNAHKGIPMTKDDFGDRMYALSRGFWCPDCGMLNRRLKWSEWECANSECSFKMEGAPAFMTADQLTAIKKTPEPNWSLKKCFDRSEDTGTHMRHHYDLQYGCCVTVIVPKAGTNAAPQGSDWLLERFQLLANDGQIDLQKQFVKAKNIGTTSNHFIHNFGHAYNLDIDIKQHKSFEDAPPELSIARDAVNSLCQRYQSKPGEEDFNQCYVAAYFRNNKMGYHSDGEMGLGSVIATWTLGGEGVMQIAPRPVQFFGRTANNTCMQEEDLLLPGVLAREERKALKEARDAKLTADPNDAEARTAYTEGFEALMKKQPARKTREPETLLQIPLTHGSVVVMHGENMQKHYEHKVSVNTPLRFALTFRNVTAANALQKSLKTGEYPHTPDTSYLETFRLEAEKKEKKEKGEGKDKQDEGDSEDDGGQGSSKRPRRDQDDESEGDEEPPTKKRRTLPARSRRPRKSVTEKSG